MAVQGFGLKRAGLLNARFLTPGAPVPRLRLGHSGIEGRHGAEPAWIFSVYMSDQSHSALFRAAMIVGVRRERI